MITTQLFRNTAPLARVAAFLVALAVLLSACATGPASEDDIVVQRAQERWEAVTSRDLEKAYSYYSPGYRSAHSVIDYGVTMRTRKVQYISSEYMDHACEESRCTVRFLVGWRVIAPIPGMPKYDGKHIFEDTWVKTSGEWWFLPEN